MRRILVTLAVALLAATAAAPAAGPDVRSLTATDVTPRSFRLVWLSGEPSSAAVRLFEAPECVNEIFTADIVPFPTIGGDAAIVSKAQDKGVMIVAVAGLQPDTDYCVQTVTTSLVTSQSTTEPDPALIVRTEKRTTRSRAFSAQDPNEIGFSNDLAKIEITRSDPLADTRGALVLLKVTGASSPLSAFVGDGIDDDSQPTTHTTLALFDLNNLYAASTHESLDLIGGAEEISARVLGSPEGFVTVHARLVPQDAGFSAVVPPNPCRDAGQTACDGRLGDSTADGAIAVEDAEAIRDLVVGITPILPCTVCGDAMWDLNDDMKDALAIAQVIAGLRLLPW